MPRKWCVVSQDGSGLGWARKLALEGEDVTLCLDPPGQGTEGLDQFWQLGDGIVNVDALPVALKAWQADPARYWIFDTNHCCDTAMTLRNAGRKVFGAYDYTADLEQDRGYAMQQAAEAGLDVPEMHPFTDMPSAIGFLEQHEDQAYVFKPDDTDASHLTFVPFRDHDADANAELRTYLDHLTDPALTSFVLQERKRGVEVNFCVWLSNGTPILGECSFENKRRLNHDLGENGPCAHDVVFTVPLDTLGLQQTAMKLVPIMAEDFTGFLDVNVIVADQQAWFLETGCRFGYNAHPNLFMTLALDPFGDLMADWIDGKVTGYADRFKRGFGASVGLSVAHPREGLPIHIRERSAANFYPYDLYRVGDQNLLTGWSDDIGIYARHGYTIREAGEAAVNDLLLHEAVSVPDMGFRTDVAKADYVNSPQQRYDALMAMGWLR